MGSASRSTTVQAPAHEAWSVIRDFGQPQRYASAVVTCALSGLGVGAVRTIIVQGGAEFKEQLRGLDDGYRTLSYSIIQSPRPVADHLATLSVRDLGDARSEITWSCSFRAVGMPDADLGRVYEQVYENGLKELKAFLES